MADDPWSQKISPYDVFMHCKTTLPSIKIDVFAVTSARSCLRSSERSTRRCTASRTRSTSTFTKCFSRSTRGPRCSRRSSRGPRGTAASSRYTQTHTHLTTISEKPQWVAVQIVGTLHIYVGRANPRSLVTSQPNECPVAYLRGSVITSWSAAYPSAP